MRSAKSTSLAVCVVFAALQISWVHGLPFFKDAGVAERRPSRQFAGAINEELIPICTRPKLGPIPESPRTNRPAPPPSPPPPPPPQRPKEEFSLEKELAIELSKMTKKPESNEKMMSSSEISLTEKEKEAIQMLARPYKVYTDGKDKVIWLPAPTKVVDKEGRVLINGTDGQSSSSSDDGKKSDPEASTKSLIGNEE